MADFTDMFENLNLESIQHATSDIRQQLDRITIKGEAGGGLVKVTLDGHGKAITIDIDNSITNVAEKKALCDLLVAAINTAHDKLKEKTKAMALANAMEMLPNILGKEK